MKKLICIFASAALFAACEQKSETVTPAAPVENKTQKNTTVVNPPSDTKKTESTTTTTSSPNT